MPGEGGGVGGGGHVVDWTMGGCYEIQRFVRNFFEILGIDFVLETFLLHTATDC